MRINFKTNFHVSADFYRSAFIVIVSLLLLLVSFVNIKKLFSYNVIGITYENKIATSGFPDVKMASFVGRNLKLESDKFLIMRQASFGYYSGKKYISSDDPKMIKFYKSKTLSEAKNNLMELGITHVITANYATPPMYNTFLPRIISDLNHSKLIKRIKGYSLYSLNNSNIDFDIKKLQISIAWNYIKSKKYYQVDSDILAYDNSNGDTIRLYNGISTHSPEYEIYDNSVKSQQDKSRRIFAIGGKMLLSQKASIIVFIYNKAGEKIREEVVWSGLANNREVFIGGQFVLAPGEVHKLAVSLSQEGKVKILDLYQTFSIAKNHVLDGARYDIKNEVITNKDFLTINSIGSDAQVNFKDIETDGYVSNIRIKGLRGYGSFSIELSSNCFKGKVLVHQFDPISFDYYLDSLQPKDLTLQEKNIISKFPLSGAVNKCNSSLSLTSKFDKTNNKRSYVQFSDILINDKRL